MSTHGPHLDAEHVCVDLLPQRGSGAAVGDHHPAHGDADVGEDLHVVAEAERDAFEDRAVQVGAGVAEVHAREHAAQIGVVDGTLLAEEVGQAQYARQAPMPPPRRPAR